MKRQIVIFIFAAAILLSANFAAAQESNLASENLPHIEEIKTDTAETEFPATTETENIASPEAEEDFFSDFDSLFEDAVDVSVEEQNAAVESIFPEEEQKVTAIKFFGNLSAEAGVGFFVRQKAFDPAFYATFENDLGFLANINSDISVHGKIHTQFPDFKISISELYMDYLLLKRVYVTLGIKEIAWGYPMLFSDKDLAEAILNPITSDGFISAASGNIEDDQNSNTGTGETAPDPTSDPIVPPSQDNAKIPRTPASVKLMPNVMYDSKKHFSVFFRFPIKMVSFSLAMMYPVLDDTNSLTLNDVSLGQIAYAASLEGVFKNISFNLFFRSHSSDAGALNNNFPHVLGLEAKGSVCGADIYGQYMMRMTNDSLISAEKYDAFIFTGGFYKYWETKTNRLFGGNIEYQYAYFPWETQKHHHAIRALIGATRLGPARNLRPAIEIYHDFMNTIGYAKAGLQVMNIFPKVHWKNGVKIDYGGENSPLPKWTVGTTFILNLDY